MQVKGKYRRSLREIWVSRERPTPARAILAGDVTSHSDPKVVTGTASREIVADLSRRLLGDGKARGRCAGESLEGRARQETRDEFG